MNGPRTPDDRRQIEILKVWLLKRCPPPASVRTDEQRERYLTWLLENDR